MDLGPLPPPEVGSTNHFSVELIWADVLKEANNRGKGNGVVKICLQQKDERPGRSPSWTNCYKSVFLSICLRGCLPVRLSVSVCVCLSACLPVVYLRACYNVFVHLFFPSPPPRN